MARDIFIGGRVPEEVKRELKARAVSSGQTMQELLESILFGYLEGNQDAAPGMDRDDLIDSIREAIQEAELPTPSLDSEDLQSLVNDSMEQVMRKEAQRRAVLEEQIRDELQTGLDSLKEELDDAVYQIESNMPELDDEDEQADDFVGFRKLMAEEVNCVIVSAFEDYPEGDTFDRIEVLRRIGRRFYLEAEEPRSPECSLNFREVLPKDFAEEVARVVRLAIEDMEFSDEKMDVFSKLAELFGKATKLAIKKKNAIHLDFSEDETDALNRLVDSFGESKPAVYNRPTLIRYLLGRELVREGRKAILMEDAFLVRIGKGLMEAE